MAWCLLKRRDNFILVCSILYESSVIILRYLFRNIILNFYSRFEQTKSNSLLWIVTCWNSQKCKYLGFIQTRLLLGVRIMWLPGLVSLLKKTLDSYKHMNSFTNGICNRHFVIMWEDILICFIPLYLMLKLLFLFFSTLCNNLFYSYFAVHCDRTAQCSVRFSSIVNNRHSMKLLLGTGQHPEALRTNTGPGRSLHWVPFPFHKKKVIRCRYNNRFVPNAAVIYKTLFSLWESLT